MWPDSFPIWWPLVGQVTYDRTRRRLIRYPLLTVQGAANWRVDSIARAAVRAVFDRADHRQAFPGHFPNPNVFRQWAVPCGYHEALRLIPEQEHVRPWIEQLPTDDQRVLVWAYVDQFNDRQFATVLAGTAQEARARVSRAYQTFCQLLRANQYGGDDDPATFPPPPLLFGVA